MTTIFWGPENTNTGFKMVKIVLLWSLCKLQKLEFERIFETGSVSSLDHHLHAYYVVSLCVVMCSVSLQCDIAKYLPGIHNIAL